MKVLSGVVLMMAVVAVAVAASSGTINGLESSYTVFFVYLASPLC